MLRLNLAVLLAIAAGVAVFAHHQLLFGLACIVAGACILSWPRKYTRVYENRPKQQSDRVHDRRR